MGEIAEFLDGVFGERHEGLYVSLWRKADKTSASFESHAEAEAWAAEGTDVYFTCALQAVPIEGPKRARAATAAAIPGVWADIDVNGPTKTGAANSFEEADELARVVLAPTWLWNSGNGMQAFWLFEDGLWMLSDEVTRKRAAKLTKGWVARLAQNVPWRLDPVGDLARILRLPGTWNGKSTPPKRVVLLDADDPGPKYPLDKIEAERLDVDAGVAAGDLDRSIKVDTRATVPIDGKWSDVLANEPEIDTIVNGKHPKLKGKTRSEIDLTICHVLVRYGWSNQEITDALVEWRRSGGHDLKAKNAQYYARTIAAARKDKIGGDRRRHRVQQQVKAAETLDEIGQRVADGHGAADPEEVLSAWNTLVGGPSATKELVQYGKGTGDKQHTYKLVLADGGEIAIGPARDLRNMDRVAERYMAAIGHFPDFSGDGIKQRWRGAVQALLTARREVETEDETTAMSGYLHEYGLKAPTDRQDALTRHRPWRDTEEGYLYVPAGPFRAWLKRQHDVRIDPADLVRVFDALGAEQKTRKYEDLDQPSGQNSRRLWRIAIETIREGESDDE